MEVFAEDLSGKDCLIFRTGPKARAMWNDYGWACVGVKHPEDGTMEMKALVAPKWPWWLRGLFMPFTILHVRAAFVLAEKMGFKPYFERAKDKGNG